MDIQGLILRPGDRVRASGRVVSVGKSVAAWFEPPGFVAMPAFRPGHEPVLAPGHTGVRVTGVDLGRLERRRAKDGLVEGHATLTGTWRDTYLQADRQGPATQHARQSRRWRRPPCPPPAGGWPRGDGPLCGLPPDQWHALGITSMAIFRPAPGQALVVVAAEHPQQVRQALVPKYGVRLCVVRSRWTHQQIETVTQQLSTSMRPWLIYQCGLAGAQDDGQPLLCADVVQVLPAFANWATTIPDGLLRITPWLARI
ncbi:hypothetical protein [Actinomadura rudentiformis]|uniref:Uncharacterized protein n=1 Tax=Actinomadura rudentiformis TaxID=359158 RepID=A0A6H9YSY7_9ACTN|nr:hypothetical protein [Actinomadura rudentiformis]KAB2344292.1 hypothetical protein F8566_30545 [Actinomadura rudentiformis]